jgi:hypothetical protein
MLATTVSSISCRHEPHGCARGVGNIMWSLMWNGIRLMNDYECYINCNIYLLEFFRELGRLDKWQKCFNSYFLLNKVTITISDIFLGEKTFEQIHLKPLRQALSIKSRFIVNCRCSVLRNRLSTYDNIHSTLIPSAVILDKHKLSERNLSMAVIWDSKNKLAR